MVLLFKKIFFRQCSHCYTTIAWAPGGEGNEYTLRGNEEVSEKMIHGGVMQSPNILSFSKSTTETLRDNKVFNQFPLSDWLEGDEISLRGGRISLRRSKFFPL